MKITRFILYTFLLIQTNNCFAQKDSVPGKNFNRFYVSLTVGLGIPAGEFAEFNATPFNNTFTSVTSFHSISGEARTGGIGRFSAYYFASEYLGCMATVYTGNFKAKEKSAGEMMIVPLHSFENITYSYNTKAWKVSGGMIGIIASVPISKFVFSIKLLSGWQQSISPETDLVIIRENIIADYKDTYKYSQTSASSGGLGWGAGLDIRIKVGEKINFLLSADYIATRAGFSYNILVEKEYRHYYNANYVLNDEASLSFSESKQISFFNLNAGIAYVFK